MLFLHFRIGDDNCALAADQIVEIVPLAPTRAIRRRADTYGTDPADAAPDLAFDYRGRFVPVIDLCQRELGRPARRRPSTRIIVVRHDAAEPGPVGPGLIGLVAESATAMLRLDPADFAPFAPGPHGLVQRVTLRDLIPGARPERAIAP